MPALVRFLLSQFGNGAVLGLVIAQVLLFAEVGELHRLVLAGPSSALVTALFFLQAAMLFGTLGMSAAVLTLPDNED